MPWTFGKEPVPIVACAQAVTAGNDPTIALRKFALSPMSVLRFGQSSGKARSTFHPPPSITYVTTTRGGVVLEVDRGSGVPSRSPGQPS